MFRPFADWIASTELNHTLQDYSAWLAPTSQSLHIISVCVLFTAALLINMRLLRATNAGRTVSQLAEALAPWTWRAFAAAVVSGSILATGKIQDYVHNPQFMAKFALVGVNMAAFHAGAYRDVTHWDKTLPTPAGARVADMPPWPCGSP